MQKDFDEWNSAKKGIHCRGGEAPLFRERDIWFCALGTNVGYEIDGTGESFDRPIIVIRGFNKNTLFGVAVTGRKKEGEYYFYIGKIKDRDASANLSQARIIDTKRLVKKIGMLDKKTFVLLKQKMKQVLFGV